MTPVQSPDYNNYKDCVRIDGAVLPHHREWGVCTHLLSHCHSYITVKPESITLLIQPATNFTQLMIALFYKFL